MDALDDDVVDAVGELDAVAGAGLDHRARTGAVGAEVAGLLRAAAGLAPVEVFRPRVAALEQQVVRRAGAHERNALADAAHGAFGRAAAVGVGAVAAGHVNDLRVAALNDVGKAV